jgi:hypothetical protein
MVVFEGHDISELLIVLGVLTNKDLDDYDGNSDNWVFFKAREYYEGLCRRASTTAGARERSVLTAYSVTKDFLRALIKQEMGVGGDVDIAFLALLVSITDKEDFFSYCALLAPKMWS